MFWNNSWREAGFPKEGYIFELRKLTRRKYHATIKHIVNNKEKIIRENVADALKSKSVVSFWKEINKLKKDVSTMEACIIDKKNWR